jgi:hypothetical protein
MLQADFSREEKPYFLATPRKNGKKEHATQFFETAKKSITIIIFVLKMKMDESVFYFRIYSYNSIRMS